MSIKYTEDKCYTAQDIKELFESVDWLSAKYYERVKIALDNCRCVVTAWDGDKLVGLVNALEDGELTAYLHYLCVHKDYHKQGIGSHLLDIMKEKYKDYLYIMLIAENEGLKDYYSRNGFEHCGKNFVFEIVNNNQQ